MEAPDNTILTMYHPDLNATGDTTQEGFDTIYVHRGWQLMEGPALVATQMFGRPVLKVKDLTGDEIRSLLSSYGVSDLPPANTKKSELIALVSAAAGGHAVEVDGSEDESDPDTSGTTDDDQSAGAKPSGAAKKATAKKQGS